MSFRWCPRCGSTDTRAAASRAVPSTQKCGPCSVRVWSPATAGPAGAPPVAARRFRPASGRARSSKRGQPCGDSVDFLAGELLAAPDLVDDVDRGLGQERLVVEFGVGALEFLLGCGQILLEPAPLGG